MCGVRTVAGEAGGAVVAVVFMVLLARGVDGCRLKKLERMFSGYVKRSRGIDA